MSTSRLRCRGSRCWTISTAAGNSFGRADSTSVSALSPPAEAARATTSYGALGGASSTAARGPSTDMRLTLYLDHSLRQGGRVEDAAGREQRSDGRGALLRI